jgi:hypothetical protein
VARLGYASIGCGCSRRWQSTTTPLLTCCSAPTSLPSYPPMSSAVRTSLSRGQGAPSPALTCMCGWVGVRPADTAALRRATLAGRAVPVLAGASFRNRGVQPLLDAVVDLLPSPLDRPPARAVSDDGSLAVLFGPADAARHATAASARATRAVPEVEDRPCALAFKVTHDKQRGPLVFFRVYSG